MDRKVVICFQFWVSLTSLSLLASRRRRASGLWFAFNFGYLWHRYHWRPCRVERWCSCDLLSILGIFDIAITRAVYLNLICRVVICFQFWVSLTSLSLFALEHRFRHLLWFAFNFGYLWHRYHYSFTNSLIVLCCDLLSILGIFDIAITKLKFCSTSSMLWFAFNFGYLWHRYHW